jgi:hypothetical protein
MLAAVLGVMLIACVNVTNLQLARASERTREFAIHAAVGSGRWRIVRQSLAEGLVLSVAGAAIGIGIAQAGTVYFISAIADTQPPFWIKVRLDAVVLLFVMAITSPPRSSRASSPDRALLRSTPITCCRAPVETCMFVSEREPASGGGDRRDGRLRTLRYVR